MSPLTERLVNVSSEDRASSPEDGSGGQTGQLEAEQGETPKNDKPWMKMAGMGMELAGSTLGLAAVGYFVDQYRGESKGYGIAIGCLVGFGFGMFRFIQKAMQQIQN
ncbi:MAG: AtpZ/AtpI family protein [Rubripirellula sp.]